MTGLAIPGMGYAEAHWGMWLVRCPRPYCTNAMQVHRWQQRFECAASLPGGCGYTAPITWPEDPEAIEALLLMRPDVSKRNWLPGESLNDLLEQTAVHGVLPPSWMDEGGCLLETFGERVTAGRLLTALPEYRRREIGVS